MGCLGEPYHLHVCPQCQEIWGCPDDLLGDCRAYHACLSKRRGNESARPKFIVKTGGLVLQFSIHSEDRGLDLWEILVPVSNNEKIPFSNDHHEAFRRILRQLPGNNGTTSRPAGDGQWVDGDTGELCSEQMIPIRFRACRADADRMAAHARKFYDQREVMAYRIAAESDVIIANARGYRG